MKFTYVLFVIPILLLLGLNYNVPAQNNFIYSDIPNCINQIDFGDISVCLINIDGMVECYSDPKVEKYVNQFSGEGTVILGFYLNQKTYNAIDQLGQIPFDDYFKIYSIDVLKGVNTTTKELDKMGNWMEEDYTKINWEEFKKKIYAIFDDYTLAKPLLLETYSPHNRIRSLVVLTKIMAKESEKFRLLIVNLVEIKSRLLYYTYVKDFNGEASIIAAKNKSDLFGIKLIKDN